MSTLTVPDQLPHVAEDCERLKKAFDGWGTDEATIVSILAHRNAARRTLIRQTYVETYGEDLLTALDKELSSDFERIVHLWTMDPAERDALLANDSIRKRTADLHVIMEIACTRTSHEVFLARQAYLVRYKRSLEEDVAHQITGDFRKLLVPLVTAYRYQGPEVDMTLAKSEAKILNVKILEKCYSHEELIRILTTRSKEQINATLNQYNDLFGHCINKDLKTEPKDEYQKLLRATIKCLTCPDKYFEKVLRLSMKGLGTDEEALTRVVVTRADVDMKLIKENYYRRNSEPLDAAIKGDTSGDYEKMLLALIGHGNT